jgi:hypothetical protein
MYKVTISTDEDTHTVEPDSLEFNSDRLVLEDVNHKTFPDSLIGLFRQVPNDPDSVVLSSNHFNSVSINISHLGQPSPKSETPTGQSISSFTEFQATERTDSLPDGSLTDLAAQIAEFLREPYRREYRTDSILPAVIRRIVQIAGVESVDEAYPIANNPPTHLYTHFDPDDNVDRVDTRRASLGELAYILDHFINRLDTAPSDSSASVLVDIQYTLERIAAGPTESRSSHTIGGQSSTSCSNVPRQANESERGDPHICTIDKPAPEDILTTSDELLGVDIGQQAWVAVSPIRGAQDPSADPRFRALRVFALERFSSGDYEDLHAIKPWEEDAKRLGVNENGFTLD